MGRRRHTMAVEALVPPDATRVATRIAAHSATVYTNGKKLCREAILANLCTLFASGDRPTLRDPRGRSPARPTRASKAEPPPVWERSPG